MSKALTDALSLAQGCAEVLVQSWNEGGERLPALHNSVRVTLPTFPQPVEQQYFISCNAIPRLI